MIIAITGYPKAGKSTLANRVAEKYNLELIHTDDYIDQFPFKDVPLELITRFENKNDFVIEGVQVSRMLKYGFKPSKAYWVFGGQCDNPISKTVFNAFSKYVSEVSINEYEIVYDIDNILY